MPVSMRTSLSPVFYNDRILLKHGVCGIEEVVGEHLADVFLGRAEERTGWIAER